jgi:hypothetical protein
VGRGWPLASMITLADGSFVAKRGVPEATNIAFTAKGLGLACRASAWLQRLAIVPREGTRPTESL